MRKAGLLIVLLVLTAGRAWTQGGLAPSTEDGPLNAKPSQPTPDDDGVYSVGPGILAPSVTQKVYVKIPDPDHVPADSIGGVCLLSLVVDSEGLPKNIEVVTSHGEAFDRAAIEAIEQFKFEPGTLDGKPVPVRVYAWTRFFADMRPPVTRILVHNSPSGEFSRAATWIDGASRPGQQRNYDTPPEPLFSPVAEYSDQARRKRIEGVVVASVLINEKGRPTDVRIEKPLGYGLDENALECIGQYKFKPATKDGVPVATRIHIEINFRLR
jgi:TonB family protein